MKATPLVLALLILLTAPLRTFSATITEAITYTPGLAVPDNSIVGAADTHIFSSAIFSISEVRVGLTISGTPGSGDAFNGDLYAYLTHSSGFAVLLNRPGRTAGNSDGYADSGFAVTFADATPSADIHNYRLFAPITSGPLTGTWNSDGRAVSPLLALDTTPRGAFLTSFNGVNPNGEWTLFVADLSPAGTARVESWRLEVTGEATPEPSAALLALAGTATLLAHRRRRPTSR